MKKRPEQHACEDLFDLIEDALAHLEDRDEEEYTTNQHVVGMRYLFRCFIVKTWKGVNFTDTTCRNLNKIVVHYCDAL